MSKQVKVSAGDKVLLHNGDEAIVNMFDKLEQSAIIGVDHDEILLSVTNHNYIHTRREIQFGCIKKVVLLLLVLVSFSSCGSFQCSSKASNYNVVNR